MELVITWETVQRRGQEACHGVGEHQPKEK